MLSTELFLNSSCAHILNEKKRFLPICFENTTTIKTIPSFNISCIFKQRMIYELKGIIRNLLLSIDHCLNNGQKSNESCHLYD